PRDNDSLTDSFSGTDKHTQIVIASWLLGELLFLPISVLSCFVAQIWLRPGTKHQHTLKLYVLGY
ncbi:hypothetical protein CGI79_24640, partial [Vibrio parahaemolyticus]